jgi:hypothetical protein
MTAKEIDSMTPEELEQVAYMLTPEENELWAFWGYDGRTYELIMIGRQSKANIAESYRKELEGTLI